jgi:23S rRNA (adenine2503-C2)-methyltransferase
MPYLVPPEELGQLLTDLGRDSADGPTSYRPAQLRRWLYRQPVLRADDMTNLPIELRRVIRERLWPFTIEVERSADDGKTRKWLFRTADGAAIEAVLMGYPGRATLCVSSQAGCALGCTFCATGQFGFERHLEPGEIVAQLAYAQAFLRQIGMPGAPTHVTNLVFMGMGEPLANYDRVREALRRIIEVMGMSPRSITVSTVGVVPGIRRLAEEPWPLNVAVSLHAADDALRTRLVPLNKRYPLAEVEAAAAHYFERKHRRISIEWTMIDGVNDSQDQAAGLAGIAKRLRAHVNLIPLNATPLSSDRPSSPRTIQAFVDLLKMRGVPVTVRDTRGKDIDAACGQLRAVSISRRAATD